MTAVCSCLTLCAIRASASSEGSRSGCLDHKDLEWKDTYIAVVQAVLLN